ncbi:MAG: hypothetical protein ACXW1W_02735 [Methylococcaceae bacterium]
MAKVTYPLFSETAHGNMGKGVLQYRAGLGGTHVYKPLAPAKQNQQPASTTQAKQRARFLAVRERWRLLPNDLKTAYKQRAAAIGGLNGWMLYVSLSLAKSIYPDDTVLCSDGLPLLVEYGEIIRSD